MKRIGILLLAVTCCLSAAAQDKIKTLFQFSDGDESEGNLVFDSAGNLYGTTGDQLNPSLITVFELGPTPHGPWTENVLWTATGGSDPVNIRSGVIFDAGGNLYGTSRFGGTYGCGTVFKLTHDASGSWTESNLFNFDCSDGGALAVGGVTFDKAGNLYGTTPQGGEFGYGIVYELTPSSSGTWTQAVLHNFTGGSDGAYPDHPYLIFDSSGNLYGTATGGGQLGNCPLWGSPGCGTIFKLAPKAGGTWKFTVLHSFTGLGGGNPEGTLVFDNNGHLFGTASVGGVYGFGVVFQLIPHSGGSWWSEKVLHHFRGGFDGGFDGDAPLSGVIFDSAGNLYGTTTYGGVNQCSNAPGCGILYELKPNSDGTYKEDILWHFHGKPNDGPYSNLVMDSSGNLYGTASGYDTAASGSVYEVVR